MAVKKRYLVGLLLATILTLLVLPVRILMVVDEKGLVRWFRPVSPGQRFTVQFLHSVALRPVDEVYSIGDGIIAVEETRYDMNGAGLPHEAGPGQTMTLEEGHYVLRGYDLKLPELTYRISRTVADHLFIFGTTTHRLREWGRPGGPITFKTGHRSLLLCFIAQFLPLPSYK